MLFISFIQVTFLLNDYLAKASKIYLIIPAVSLLEKAGFIRNKILIFIALLIFL